MPPLELLIGSSDLTSIVSDFITVLELLFFIDAIKNAFLMQCTFIEDREPVLTPVEETQRVIEAVEREVLAVLVEKPTLRPPAFDHQKGHLLK